MNPISAYTFSVPRLVPYGSESETIPTQNLLILRKNGRACISVRILTGHTAPDRYVVVYLDQANFQEQLQDLSVTQTEVVVLDFVTLSDVAGNPLRAVCHWVGQIHQIDSDYLYVPTVSLCQA